MYTEEERAKFRERIKAWKAGEKVYEAGRPIVEKTDATTIQRQEPVQPIKRDFIAEAQRKHAAEAVGPDTRSSYQRKQSQAAKQYANQQHQKAKDDAKRAEGMEQMMKTISPSTYVEAATRQDLGTVGRLATDAVAFGLPGAAKAAVNLAIRKGTPILAAAMMKKGIYDATKNGGIQVGKSYFKNPNSWYRVTQLPEIQTIRELGHNVTTRDWELYPSIADRWRTGILEAKAIPGTGINEGYFVVPKKQGIDLTKVGSAHGNRSQAAKGQIWSGNFANNDKFPNGVLEGDYVNFIDQGLSKTGGDSRTSFTTVPWENVPIGARVGFKSGDMPIQNLSWFQELPNGRYRYEPVIPSKNIQPVQNASSAISENPYKLGSDFETDTKELFKRMKSFQIRQSLAQTKIPETNQTDGFGIMDLSKDVIHHEGMPNFVEDVFRYQVLPRTNIRPIDYDSVIQRLSKYGYNTTDDYTWAKYVNEHTAGYLDNSTYGIAIRDGYMDYAAPHEFRHRMQKIIPYRHSLMIDRKGYLDRAYGDDFVNLPKNVPESDSLYGYTLMEDEKATTNLDARRWAFENLSDNPKIGKASLKEQNEFLDNLTDDEIIEAVAKGNSYGRKYIDFLERTYDLLNNPRRNAMYANNFRNAMKYYGIYGVPTAFGWSIYNKYAE